MQVVPDFGYDKGSMDFKEDVNGWRLLYDYVQKEPKYQKLTNYIASRTKEQEEKKLRDKKKKSKRQLILEQINHQ